MGYNMENFRKIREEYKEKYKKAEAEADARRRELWQTVDGLRDLDDGNKIAQRGFGQEQ